MSRRKVILIVAIASVAVTAGMLFLPRDPKSVGLVVHGTISQPEISEIEILLRQRTPDPILSIHPAGFDRWEVWTGVVRRPLDGGGDIFIVEKRFGKWTVIDDGIRGWVS